MTSREDRNEILLDLINQATLADAQSKAVLTFINSIVSCMRDDKVGLEKSIQRNNDFVHAMIEIEPIDTAAGETEQVRHDLNVLLTETFEVAADHVRRSIAMARDLVALADQEDS